MNLKERDKYIKQMIDYKVSKGDHEDYLALLKVKEQINVRSNEILFSHDKEKGQVGLDIISHTT